MKAWRSDRRCRWTWGCSGQISALIVAAGPMTPSACGASCACVSSHQPLVMDTRVDTVVGRRLTGQGVLAHQVKLPLRNGTGDEHHPLLLASGRRRMRCCLAGWSLLRATLNKSLAARSSLFWAVFGVANPRHSWAMSVVCALQPIPNQGAHTREDLFSVALAGFRTKSYSTR